MGPSSRPPSTALIPVGDAWRAALWPPVFGTLGLALAFLLYTAPIKEAPQLFDHAPWLNDPFDTVISFMMFFVPLIAAICIPRVLMCRRSEPLPASRIRDVLRGCRVVLAGVGLTLLCEWVSVVIGENGSAWNWATWVQIGLLAMMSVLTLAAARAVGRAGLPGQGSAEPTGTSSDWLEDALAFVRKESHRLGPARPFVVALVDFTDQALLKVIRRHPLWMALALCLIFGAGAGINQGVRESYTSSITVMASLLLATGMFGLVVVAGHYLGLVHSSSPLHGVARRRIDATVITCVGVLIPFALRYHLWWVVGSTNQAAGLGQLLGLLGISAFVLFVSVYAVESLLRLHAQDPPNRA